MRSPCTTCCAAGAWIPSISWTVRTRLQALGKTVLLSRCAEFHRIAAFLYRYTSKPIGIILSIGLLNELFKPKWSENLPGGLLESFGRLFKEGVTLHVFPWKNRHTGELVTADTFMPPADCVHLYRHFIANGRIQGIPCEDSQSLVYTGRDVCRMIRCERRPLAGAGSRNRLDHGRASRPARGFLSRRSSLVSSPPRPAQVRRRLEQVEVRAAIHAAEASASR